MRAVTLAVIVLLLAGCSQPATGPDPSSGTASASPSKSGTASPSPSPLPPVIEGFNKTLAKPLWDFPASADGCDPYRPAATNSWVSAIPGLKGTDRQIADTVAAAMRDSVTNTTPERIRAHNPDAVTFTTVHGTIQVGDLHHDGRVVTYNGTPIAEWDSNQVLQALVKLGVDRANITVTPYTALGSPDGVQFALNASYVRLPSGTWSPYVAPVAKGAAKPSGISGDVPPPRAILSVWSHQNVTAGHVIGEDMARRIAYAYDSCWLPRHMFNEPPVQRKETASPPNVTMTSWNGAAAYIVTVPHDKKVVADEKRCNPRDAPILVDAGTGRVLGHYWLCITLEDGPAIDPGTRRDLLPWAGK